MKFVSSQLAYFLSEREQRRNVRALLRYAGVLLLVMLLYTALFHVIMIYVEGQRHSLISGFYWVVVTMTTLGFGDITFLTDLGRFFSTVVLLTGIVLLLIMLPFMFIRYFAAPWLEAQVRHRAPRRIPEATEGHVVLCSWDSIAPGLVDKLKRNDIPYYVLEPNPERAARMHGDGISVVTAELDARVTYEMLNADRARLIFANLDDATNTNIAITIREVAPHANIAALASDEESIDILEMSGCNHVLPLRHQLGEQLANRVNAGQTRAHVVGRFHDLLIAEFPVQNTPLAGRTIRDTRLREATGASIIAGWERGHLHPPRPDLALSDHSVPVVLGSPDQIAELETLLIIYHTNDNPVVIIGGGKVGRAACRALKREGIPVHVIERKAELAPRIGELPDRLFIGDAADRRVLEDAGLLAAPSVLLSTHDDATNIYLAVYCRRLNPDLRIVSRVTHDRNVEAVLRAGADFVLSYDSLGVQSLVSLLLDRQLVVLGEGVDLFQVPVPASLVDRTLAESGIGARTGLTVVAAQRDGQVMTNLRPAFRFTRGTELVLIGSPEQRELFAAKFQ
jgi:voltage-gated potassium channel